MKDFSAECKRSALINLCFRNRQADLKPNSVVFRKNYFPGKAPGWHNSLFPPSSHFAMSVRLPPPLFEKKIVTFHDLKTRAAALPHPVVMTNGVFDILHRGHVTYLAQARALGKSLIVAVNSDTSVKMLGKGDDRPINTESDRAAVLASLESVDLVVVFPDKVPLKVIEEAHPDIYAKGGDYRIEDLPEAKLVAGWGAKTVTVEFEFARSTTALLKKVRSA